MRFSEALKNYVQNNWERCRAQLGERQREVETAFAECTGEEALLLRFLYLSLPCSDGGSYPAEFFLSEVRHSLWLREHSPFCSSLPEPLFLLYVLCPRINTEELRPCREQFRKELWERVKGLSGPEALLEVNCWCAEQATYRSTDERTASAAAVYYCGHGRCGEESVFLVSALRSVGIAARQIYAPRWSHCEDNHAWVEAFDGERWRFLGACEPEPVLDLGWFPHSASRAMLEHSRAFFRGSKEEAAFLFPGAKKENLVLEGGVAYENVTARYAKTGLFRLRVEDTAGLPAAGAKVSLFVLNMAEFFPLTQITADEKGEVALTLGFGSLLVTAQWQGQEASRLLDLSEMRTAVLRMGEKAFQQDVWSDFDFLAPEAFVPNYIVLSAQQKQQREQVLEQAAQLREKRDRNVLPPQGEKERRSFFQLTEKDRWAPVSEEAIADSLLAYVWEEEFPKEIFEPYLLCQRIGLEPLAPWRKKALNALPKEKQSSFQKEPEKLWQWICGEFYEDPETYQELLPLPASMLALKGGPLGGRKVLFVAFCRALGVPARLAPEDSEPEYYQTGSFHRLGVKSAGLLKLCAPQETAGLFRQNWSLSQWDGTKDRFLSLSDIPAGGSKSFSLPAGNYRLITTMRKPDGDQLGKAIYFTLSPGETKEFALEFRSLALEDLLEKLPLPEITLTSLEGGQELPVGEALGQAPCIAAWLELGREPTEHILNELRESAEAVKASGLQVHLVMEKKRADPTLEKLLAALPSAKLWQGNFVTDGEILSRQLYLDSGGLPIIFLKDTGGLVRYACCGYRVGTAELLLRVAAQLEKTGS